MRYLRVAALVAFLTSCVSQAAMAETGENSLRLNPASSLGVQQLIVHGRWSSIHFPVSPPKHNHSVILDPKGDRLLFFGGGNNRNTEAWNHSNELFALPLSPLGEWSLLPTANRQPGERVIQTGIYDPVRERLIIFAGTSISAGQPFDRNDVWFWSVDGSSGWTLLPVNQAPGVRHWQSAIYDSKRDRMVIFGGIMSFQPFFREDMWELLLSQNLPFWEQIDDGSLRPGRRYDHSAIYDPVRDRMLVFGGWKKVINGLNRTNELWSFDFRSSQWTLLAPGGERPGAMSGHGAAYDPVRDRMLVYGGGLSANKVWELSLKTPPVWQELEPSGRPPFPRLWPGVLFDTKRHRLLVHGGMEQKSRGDLHALRFCLKELMIIANIQGSGNFQGFRGQALNLWTILGSSDFDPGELDLTTLLVAGVPVTARNHGSEVSARRDVNHDGIPDLTLAVLRSDLQELTFNGEPLIEIDDHSGALFCATAVHLVPLHDDAGGGQIVTIEDGDSRLVTLNIDTPIYDQGSGTIRLALTLPSSGTMRLQLYNIQGRLIAVDRFEALAPGSIDRNWNPGLKLGAGIYFIRVIQANVAIARKLVVLP